MEEGTSGSFVSFWSSLLTFEGLGLLDIIFPATANQMLSQQFFPDTYQENCVQKVAISENKGSIWLIMDMIYSLVLHEFV